MYILYPTLYSMHMAKLYASCIILTPTRVVVKVVVKADSDFPCLFIQGEKD